MGRGGAMAVCGLVASIGAGCAWTEGGVRKTLVLGVGVVETAHVNEGVLVVHERAGGVLIGEVCGMRGVFVGVAERRAVSVPAGAQALVEVIEFEEGDER